MENRAVKGMAVLCLWLAAIAASPGTAPAAGFPAVDVEYSADRHVTGGGGGMSGKVHSTPGKERMEMGAGGAVTILRMDKKLVWTLLPSEKQYMEHALSGQVKRATGDYRECDVRQTDAGSEVVNGIPARKLAMEIACPGDDRQTGTIWLTKENIPVKMEASKAGAPKKDAVRMELKNLKIGKQDPGLFEIPAGYRKMEVPSMGDLQEMMKGQSR